MAEVTYKGKTFEVDEDGFLLKFDEWCPEWLEYVKESEGITDLNEDHQKILLWCASCPRTPATS